MADYRCNGCEIVLDSKNAANISTCKRCHKRITNHIRYKHINEIANPKGWEYKPRKATRERQFGYHFVGCALMDSGYFTRITADNPVDAANKLRHIRETKRLLSPPTFN